MKTVNLLLQESIHFLCEHAIQDADFEAREIVLMALGIDRNEFSFRLSETVSSDDEIKTFEMLQKRADGMPLQYVLGEWDFYGNTFTVFPQVLIPRPETEELTDMVIRYIKENNCRTVYDICAGTGCIGLSVAIACPNVEVYLFELYEKPLQCIKQNIDRHGLKNIHVVSCDVLQPISCNIPSADIIISNPPYIPSAEMKSLQREVLQEPHTALDGGDDGLLFYRAIAEHWFNRLNSGGVIYFECAEDQPLAVIELFLKQHDDIDSACGLKDFYGLDRFVYIKKKG